MMFKKLGIIGSTFLVLVIFGASVTPAQAAVPKLLAYHGVLKNNSGSYLTGTYSIIFRIYSASTGGSALWTETQSSVSASSGKFSVLLGSVQALNLDFNADYWLSVQVGADAEMSPRVRLTSMGYGIRTDYENNGFTQSQHDALSHENIAAVKENSINIAKTNFKIDSYAISSANNMNDLALDTFNDASGIDAASSGHAWRVSPYYDVIVTPGGIDTNTKLVLHANGTDGSSAFVDSSSGAKTVSVTGNAQVDTAQSKFGGASALFDGSGDYLSTANSADWDFGTGNFTVDFWVKFNTVGYSVLAVHANADTSYFYIHYNTTWSAGWIGGPSLTGGTASTNTWYHVAFVKNGSAYNLYVDGVSVASATNASTIPTYSGPWDIGASTYNNTLSLQGQFNGWIEEYRVTKGVARWTSNFTPPASEYTTSASTATVISQRYTQTSVPTEAMIIADETLGTGSITYSVSRDDGTTWTPCTKETVTSISTQPSNTQVRWKAVITGNAELNAIAVAV